MAALVSDAHQVKSSTGQNSTYQSAPTAADNPMGAFSYIVPVLGSAVAMAACYFLGRYNYSFGWLVIFVGISFIKTKMWRLREQRLVALRSTALREREVVMAQLQDLPAWVQFPDTERVEWINRVIHQLWPYIGEYVKQFIREFIEPQVRANLPGPFKSFRFAEIDMGDIPLRVGGIKVYTENVGRDRIIMDMDVAYAGDCDFTVQVGMFKGGLNEVHFKGKLRAVLKPLLPYPPMVGGVSAFFLEMPTMDFNLTGIGELVEIPGLLNAIRAVVDAQMASICVLPNEIVVSLAPNVDLTKLYFPEPDGVLRINVVEARNLVDKDGLLNGKSDPYCTISVGSQIFKTKVIDDNLSPKWNEYFEGVVDVASGQMLRVEVYDKDVGSKDEELGRLILDIERIRKKGRTDKWYALEATKHGDLHLQLHWMNLSSEAKDLEQEMWEKDWLKFGKQLHPAILMIYVDNASNLPYPRAKVEPSPMIRLTLGKDVKITAPKLKTVNPLFQQKFIFWVTQPESQELKVEAIDEGTKKLLGDVSVSLKMVMGEPMMELYQHTFSLNLGVHQSPLVMTVRLRAVVGGVVGDDRTEFNAANFSNLIAPIAGLRAAASLDANVTSERKKTVSVSPTSVSHSMSIGSGDGGKGKRQSSNFRGSTSMLSRLTSKQQRLANSSMHNGSVVDVGGPPSHGRLRVAVKFIERDRKLLVTVFQCESLKSVNENNTADPYVKVTLLNGDGANGKAKTSIAVNTLDPTYDAEFNFDIALPQLLNSSLLFQVKDATNYGIFATAPVLGQVKILFDKQFDTTIGISDWLTLGAPSRTT